MQFSTLVPRARTPFKVCMCENAALFPARLVVFKRCCADCVGFAGKIAPVIPVIPEPKWWQRQILTFAASRPGSWLLSRILERLDKTTLQLTADKQTLTTLLTGLPVIRLTTYGAVSGLPRVCPLLPLPDGDNLIVFATNFGAARHPSWYLNLKENPDVLVSLNGSTGKYLARPVDESERSRYWRLAVAMYPGFGSYAARSRGRRIPIVRLSPSSDL